MTYSYQQLGHLAAEVGIPASGGKRQRVAHIALAESSGEPNARNPKQGTYANGTFDTGLWQINSVHQKTHPMWTEQWLKDPHNNAEAMSILSSNGQNFQPWEASRQAWEKPGVGDITPGFDSSDIPIVGPIGDAAQNTAETLGSSLEYAAKTYRWIGNPQNWLRIAYVSLGAGVVLVGLAKLIGYDSGAAKSLLSLKTGGATAAPAKAKAPAEAKPIKPTEL